MDPSSIDVNGCSAPNKPTAVIAATDVQLQDGTMAKEITGSITLACTTSWVLSGRVFLRAGASITIQPGTTIRAEKASNAGLVVMPGARLVAVGDKYFPIVFTSDQPAPAPGDWRGVVVLGNAPPGTGAHFANDLEMPFGGANADDDSGALSFVRVEYGALGMVLAGVGRKTAIDSVQVRKSIDNCFSLTGGTVDAKHLVCQFPGDEYFEIGGGYSGRLQYIFGQKVAADGVDHNGLLTDGSSPVIYNATLCGGSQTTQSYGLVVRSSSLDMNNAILESWFSAIDVRGAPLAKLSLRSSTAFGNAANPACAETAAVTDATQPTFDDDLAFDETAWFRTAGLGNTEADPALVACSDAKNPKPYPTAARAGAKPPADGFFDTNATYVGAFRDANDAWLSGVWAKFDDK